MSVRTIGRLFVFSSAVALAAGVMWVAAPESAGVAIGAPPVATPAPESVADISARLARLFCVERATPLSGKELGSLKVGVRPNPAASAATPRPDVRWLVPDIAIRVRGEHVVRDAATRQWMVGTYDAGERAVIGSATYKDIDELYAALDYHALPKPPEGFTLCEVARLPDFPTRLASDGKGGPLFVLCQSGDVYRVDRGRDPSLPRRVLEARSYLKAGYWFTLGLMLDPDGRLYVVANERDDTVTPVMNRVTIFRTAPRSADAVTLKQEPWLKVEFPYEIKTFNHGVSHIAAGPDGCFYVNSGSRTDAGEEGEDPRFAQIGEIDLTACVWRIDPRNDPPRVEVFARGLRNTYGFCWDARGRMIATDNGPNRDAPEELNFIEQGRHYGFPYAFSDLAERPYTHTPKAPKPAGEFVKPIPNLGPDGGYADGRAISTFTPHSCPSGIVCLGADFPEAYRGAFLVARFGNMIPGSTASGFDLLRLDLQDNDGKPQGVKVHRMLSPLGRPIDVHHWGEGTIAICEYAREVTFPSSVPMLPGRILELRAEGRR
ncbi:PQQ-dependent sugar dehydrogenase [Humisphaera borealis]|uniref:PQQ-dependent sugar dehydrogenase n=1 Tax=Humisphaera borealis TaxID=2807512 RepID=A0A7M2WQ34_9BACT|nr:PQQ-dependent sugar dehydrogenase [Humisphaera borealis]QOV87588.1 PQQ-dependent sugar dehydrogenase [Humisphaera borealis]